MERYLRILDYDRNQIVKEMTYEICKFQLNDPCFLNYRPSMISACALLISINIYEKNEQEKQKKKLIVNSQIDLELYEMNFDIWNN